MLKIAIGITGWRENLCLDDGIKEPDHAKNRVLTRLSHVASGLLNQ